MAGELGDQGLKDALVILGAAGIVIPAFARLRITPVIGFILVGTIVGPFGLGALAAERPVGAVTLGVALAMSSTALVLPIAGTSSPVGRAAFAMLLFEDLALVPLLFVLASSAPIGALPLVFLKGAGVIVAMLIA